VCAIKYYTRIIHTFKKSQRVQYDSLGGVCNCRAMQARTRATKSHVWQRSYAFWQFGDSTCRQVVVQLASAADNNNCIYVTSLINHPAISAFSASDSFSRFLALYKFLCVYVRMPHTSDRVTLCQPPFSLERDDTLTQGVAAKWNRIVPGLGWPMGWVGSTIAKVLKWYVDSGCGGKVEQNCPWVGLTHGLDCVGLGPL